MKKLFFFIFLIFSASANQQAQLILSPAERRLVYLQKNVEPLYRKPTLKELKAVAPRRELFVKYADFLRQPETGLTKLIDDKGCAVNTKVVVATESCLQYTMPGAGSSFSFRTRNYRIPRLADLTFTDQSFRASGVLLHGIFVNLGDVPLERVDLQTAGMKYLVEFQPEPDYNRGGVLDLQLTSGVRSDGFLYRRGLYTVDGVTFALRSIAYGGKYFRAAGRVTYNEFDYDRRRDVIVAFRIVDKDESGNVTILWKELQDRAAPAIKRGRVAERRNKKEN